MEIMEIIGILHELSLDTDFNEKSIGPAEV